VIDLDRLAEANRESTMHLSVPISALEVARSIPALIAALRAADALAEAAEPASTSAGLFPHEHTALRDALAAYRAARGNP